MLDSTYQVLIANNQQSIALSGSLKFNNLCLDLAGKMQNSKDGLDVGLYTALNNFTEENFKDILIHHCQMPYDEEFWSKVHFSGDTSVSVATTDMTINTYNVKRGFCLATKLTFHDNEYLP